MVTEADIRRWVRDEQRRIDEERQAACTHANSGTLHETGDITCDQCGKLLQPDDTGTWDFADKHLDAQDQKRIQEVRRA